MYSAVQPHFIGLGHVSFDVNLRPDGRPAPPEPGGAAMFGALTALGMGMSAGVITAASADYPFAKVARSVSVRLRKTDQTTTFRAEHDGRRRAHRRLADAGPLTREDIPEGWRRPEVLLIGPLAGELPAGCRTWFEPQLSCAVAQGWLRRWKDDGEEFVDPTPPAGIEGLDVVVVSDHEVPGERLAAWREACRTLAVTRGEQGVTIFEGDRHFDVPAFPADLVDPTGAGDVWAAAFSIRLFETGDTERSALFANAAAAISVEKSGLTGVPTRGEIEQRMARL